MKGPLTRMLVVLIVLAIFGLGGWYVEIQRAKMRSALTGYFDSQPTQVASRTGGRIARIFVHEGDSVTAGEPLLRIEAAPTREQTVAKQQVAEQARQQLREARSGPRPQEIERQSGVAAEARANLARLVNGPLPEEVAQARARLNLAAAQMQRVVAGARPQEIAGARAAERSAYEHYAALKRGGTPEELAEARARLNAAAAQERLARSDAGRYAALYTAGAISRQQLEQAQTAQRTAEESRKQQAEAYKRAVEGTPAEELDQARQADLQVKASLDLLLAGPRTEDVRTATAQRDEAAQALKQLLGGSRAEDIRAANARLRQAEATLAELKAGTRNEVIAAAAAAAAASSATARASETELAERIVRAPRDGVIESVPIAVGDLVNVGAFLIRLDSPVDIWLRVYVPEADLSHVRVGSQATLQIDGVPQPVPALVETVATRGEFTPANLQSPDERGKQVYAVRLRLREPDSRVKAGMFATVKRIGDWQP